MKEIIEITWKLTSKAYTPFHAQQRFSCLRIKHQHGVQNLQEPKELENLP